VNLSFPFELFSSLLFPSFCRLCGQALRATKEKVVCLDCLKTITPAAAPSCPLCGLLPGVEEREICARCRLEAPAFLRHRSFAFYQGPLQEIIQLYKFQELESLSRVLADFLLISLGRDFSSTLEIIVPVPADRRHRRAFAPVKVLARRLARSAGISLQTGNLVKTRSTSPQVGLNSRERRRNLRNAFELRRPDLIADRDILLLDDVWTTGTTIRECAAVLAGAGARVHALTIARTPF